MEKANVTIKANVASTNSTSARISQTDKRKIHGAVFAKMEPKQFDKRKMEIKHSTVTEKQLKEFLDDLPCALCLKVGGGCGCGT